jgi:hypothetical protein
VTVTLKEQLAVAPPASVTTQLTVVVPITKLEPLAGEQTTLDAGQLSTTEGGRKLTIAPHEPGSLS